MIKVKVRAHDVHNALLASAAASAVAGPARRAVDAGLELLADEIRRRAPVDTGQLRDSVRVAPAGREGTDVHGEIVIDEYYAVFEEFGTSDRPARPFMRPAVEATREAVRNAMARELKRS
jgi:HK97 gp10 family phage protein